MSKLTWYETVWNGNASATLCTRTIVLDSEGHPRPVVLVTNGPTVRDMMSQQLAVRDDIIVQSSKRWDPETGDITRSDDIYLVTGARPLLRVPITAKHPQYDIALNGLARYQALDAWLGATDWIGGEEAMSVLPAYDHYDGEIGLLGIRNASILRSYLGPLPESFISVHEKMAGMTHRSHVDPKGAQAMPRQMALGALISLSREAVNLDCQPIWILYRSNGSITIHYPLDILIDNAISEDVTHALKLWPNAFINGYGVPYGMKLEVYHGG